MSTATDVLALFGYGAVLLIGALWFAFPKKVLANPVGMLELKARYSRNPRIADIAHSAGRAGASRQRAGLVFARCFAALIVVIAVAGFALHAGAAVMTLALLPVAYVYSVIVAIVNAESSTEREQTSLRAAIADSSLADGRILAVIVLTFVQALLLAVDGAPLSLALAMEIVAASPVFLFIQVTLRSTSASATIQRALTARLRCGVEVTAIQAPNVAAFGFVTFRSVGHDLIASAIKLTWLAVVGLMTWYLQTRWARLDRAFDDALR